MVSTWLRGGFILAVLGLSLGSTAWAEVFQKLDSVDAVSSSKVLSMRFGRDGSAATPIDSSATVFPASGQTFLACQRTASRDLYCLMNSTDAAGQRFQYVRRWYQQDGAQRQDDVVNCADPALNLDNKRANPCTSLTVDLQGNIWLAGRDGTAHRVLKLVKIPLASCPALQRLGATTPTTADDYCFRPYATGRPVIVDMTFIDTTQGKGFTISSADRGGSGVLLLEDRKTAIFVEDRLDANSNPLPPVEIASGKAGWGLSGNELVQSASLIQKCATDGCTDPDNFVVVTTSGGKLIARRTDQAGLISPKTLSPSPISACASALPQQYVVRVSAQTGQVFVSDRSCNRVLSFDVAYNASVDPANTVAGLSLSPVTPPSLSTAAETNDDTTTSNSLNTLSVSPGIPINLDDCSGAAGCVIVPNQRPTDGNQIGAKLTQVQLDTLSSSNMTAFRITGIPDCRVEGVCSPDLVAKSVVNTSVGQFLDVAKLLPQEVLELFNSSTDPTRDGLRLLISPQFGARPDKNYTFEAFFGRTEDGVYFREKFNIALDIRELEGVQSPTVPSRCGYTSDDPAFRNPQGWDAIVTVSERVKVASILDGDPTTYGSPAPNPSDFVDMLVNTSCINPTSGSGDRWSLYAYGLMLNENPQGNAIVGFMENLYDDLERARATTACKDYDKNGGTFDQAPLSPALCSTLKSDWYAALDKLDKCVAAVRDKKSSQSDQNCQSFNSQFDTYRKDLGSANIYWKSAPSAPIPDKANRVGELKARTDVIKYVFNCQFLPATGSVLGDAILKQCRGEVPW